jgi:hypothetical protein
MGPELTVAVRFWQGLVASTLILAVAIWFLTVVMGAGREFAPLVAIILTFSTLPVIMLINGWVLFVTWRSRLHLFLGSLVIPSVMLMTIMLFLEGAGDLKKFGTVLLAPLFGIMELVVPYPILALTLWVLAMALIYLAAHAKTSQIHMVRSSS